MNIMLLAGDDSIQAHGAGMVVLTIIVLAAIIGFVILGMK